MTSYGTPNVLKLATAPISDPVDSQLLIRVHAASLNPLDSWIRQGYGKALFETQRKLPVVLGRDCSGVVVGVGPNVLNFKVGDEVFVATDPVDTGCFAQYVTVNENHAACKPQNLSHRETASLPFVSLTAWRALKDIAQVEEGQKVLVLGASGGVGSVAVQLLKVFGCHVDGTCSPGNIDRVKDLGAEQVFDYTDPSALEHAGGYDVVLDCSKSPNHLSEDDSEGSQHLLKEGGRWVTLRGGFIRRTDESGPVVGILRAAAELTAQRLVNHSLHRTHYDWAVFRPNGQALAEVAAMVERGHLKANVNERRFSLGDIVKAHQFWEQRHPSGKIVLEVPMGEVTQDPVLIPLE